MVAACAVTLVGPSLQADAAPVINGVTTRYVSSVSAGPLVPPPLLFGGISGIDDVGGGKYAMISTDVGRFGPARFFTARIPTNTAQIIAPPTVTGIATVLGPGNLPMLPGSGQFEGIRGFGGNFVVASGGAHQFVRIVGPGGTFIRDLPLPAAYRSGKGVGLDANRGLTGVAVSPSGRISVLTAGGLRQDPGNAARLLTFGRTNSEFVYRTDPDKVAADVLAVNNTDFLVLERGAGRNTRIYWTTTNGASNVNGVRQLPAGVPAMRKKLIFSTDPLIRLSTGNISGMAWGGWHPDKPWLTYRTRTLILVSNDVFSGTTRFHALEYLFPKS